jgi:DNA-binding Lrp family transcriptional regulator
MLRIRGQVDPLLSGEMGALCMVAVTLDGRDDDTAIGQLNALPAVLSSVRTTGESQLMMTAGAASTAAMVQTILQVVRRVPGVVTTETWQVIRYVKMIRHFTRIH